jgi:hypothetical protein
LTVLFTLAFFLPHKMIVSRDREPDPTLLCLYYISVILVTVFGLVSLAVSYFTDQVILPFNEFLTICMLILFWLTLLSVNAKKLKVRHY